MWYFTWILGVLLACAFGIINAMWLENTMDDAVDTAEVDARGKHHE
jgi:cytochrome bd-I ubiquinol oxidase subunit X